MKLTLKIPPVAQGVITLVLIWLFDRYLPVYRISFMYQRVVACALMGIGAIIAASGVIAFVNKVSFSEGIGLFYLQAVSF